MNFAESCMMRGPAVAVRVPKADRPVFCGTSAQGTACTPQVLTANCVVLAPVMLARFKMLNASHMN